MAKHGHQPQAPRPKILRIGVVLGGTIVEERLVRKRQNITVGQSAKNDFAIPAPELPKVWPLFRIVSGGRYMLNFAPGMDARISLDGAIQTLDQLKTSGVARPSGQGFQMALPDTARGKISVGEMTLLFQFVTAPRLQPRPQLPHSVRGRLSDRIDPWMALILVLSLMLHLSSMLYVYNMDMPKPPEPDEIPDRFAELLMEKPVIVEIPPIETGTVTSEAKEDTKGGDGGGDKKEPDDDGGGSGDAPPSEASVQQDIDNTAVLKVLGARSSSGAGRFVDVTGGKDVGEDLERGLGRVGEAGTAVSMGGGGLGGGTRGGSGGEIGTGEHTGVKGPKGGRGVGGPKKERAVKASVRSSGIDDIDDGGLDPSKVMATIKRRYQKGVVQCYQRGLKANPKLSGKLIIAFTIGAAGTVTKARVTGLDSSVTSCVKARVRRWRFSRPDGSAEFEVPFILRPGR